MEVNYFVSKLQQSALKYLDICVAVTDWYRELSDPDLDMGHYNREKPLILSEAVS